MDLGQPDSRPLERGGVGGDVGEPAEKAIEDRAIHAAFGTQILLGIATVLTGVALWLAVLHQLVGALLVAATTWGAHAAGRRR